MKNILILIGIVVLAIGGYTYIQQNNHIDTTASNTDTAPVSSEEPATQQDTIASVSDSTMEDGTLDVSTANESATAKTYTRAQVAMHNNATSCWSIIDGNVYDLTSWIPQHPGGERNILKICGIDGTSAFESQHAENMKAQVKRDEFLLGALVQ